jgi:transcriptional regulator with PAS, ATPase and Fis domain
MGLLLRLHLTGKFELADGGTLFLDEIGDLPTAAQVKILRVLEESIVEPVGSNQRRPVNVRIVAATHRNLADQIQEGRFRSDLYYRLNTAIIRLPPLRDRRTEIPVLAVGLLDGINQGIKRHRRIAAEALRKLESYDWPGNVRELRNVLQRAVVNTGSRSLIDAADIVFDLTTVRASASPGIPEPGDGFQLEEYLGKVRHDLLVRALEISGGNQSEAARLLGVSAQAVSSFQKKRKEQKDFTHG